MDFSASPDAVSAVAEAHRLAYGHLLIRRSLRKPR